ncbi:MAG: RNHCP domain-containing protein [Oscillospiraceae bacterium]|nr:RNHCP domain-containing protein [Oscillospiraceae bacterium]
MIKTKLFSKNDEGFICANCKSEITPLKYTSRNHCPHCLYSLHVDINPGDRKNLCGGMLKPILSEPNPDARKGYTITFKCEKCKRKTKNKSASDDDTILLIKLTNPENCK